MGLPTKILRKENYVKLQKSLFKKPLLFLTVLINDKPVRSCQVTADFIQGKKVVTIEGLGTKTNLHPVQKAFVEHDALQCGYCTPGMIITAAGLLMENPAPTSTEIIDAMEENFCRCGAYTRIIDAIQSASNEMKGGL